MDLGSVIGFIAGWIMIAGAIWSGGGLAGLLSFYDTPSVIVTFGGAVCSVLLSLPIASLMSFGRVSKKVFSYPLRDPKDLIEELVKYAEIARRDGILALEGPAKEIKDPFMVKGIQLAVDGTDPELIRETLTTELECMQARHGDGKKLMDLFGKYGPAWGMIGTLMGLVLMLKNLNDPKTIGPSMAVAIITSFYGAVIANFVCLPMADKLDIMSGVESMNKEIIIKGVMSIQSGDNPRLVAQKLKVFLPPNRRGPEER